MIHSCFISFFFFLLQRNDNIIYRVRTIPFAPSRERGFCLERFRHIYIQFMTHFYTLLEFSEKRPSERFEETTAERERERKIARYKRVYTTRLHFSARKLQDEQKYTRFQWTRNDDWLRK